MLMDKIIASYSSVSVLKGLSRVNKSSLKADFLQSLQKAKLSL